MPTTLRQRLRLNMTVSLPMRVALEDLAERNGMLPTTQATMLLRQSLDRTMQTERVQQRIRQHNATHRLKDSQEERTTEHAIEVQYAQTQGRQIEGLTQAAPAVQQGTARQGEGPAHGPSVEEE